MTLARRLSHAIDAILAPADPNGRHAHPPDTAPSSGEYGRAAVRYRFDLAGHGAVWVSELRGPRFWGFEVTDAPEGVTVTSVALLNGDLHIAVKFADGREQPLRAAAVERA